ncbi:hypothetical protein CDL15_Pgr016537 [Punica granatum]|uniref:FBD domain-containing protein n=1 Tax=Punica granatum TaxID=22663 RepID=A0A218WJC3_PUNGR|nr:hypothetical protein CDL15_Pgr016537 [Punica granatum]
MEAAEGAKSNGLSSSGLSSPLLSSPLLVSLVSMPIEWRAFMGQNITTVKARNGVDCRINFIAMKGSGSMKKRKPTRPNFEADEPSSAGAGGPFKAVVQERSPSQSTDVHAGREDQLKYVEQDPESYARKKWRVEQNAGISLIELQDRPPQAQALQNISIPTGQSKEVCNELATSLQEYGSHDAQVTRLLIAERQRQLTQSYKARIRQLKDDLSLSRKDVTSIQSNMPEALVEKNSQIVAPKKQLARSASGPASLQDLPTGYELPLFSNMIKLKLGGINSSTINGVWALVRRSPRLQSLYFRQGVNYYPEIGRDELLHPLPSCFFTELKKISLVIFHGRYGRKQLFMVGIFLEKALALREMVIHVAEYCIGKENLLKDLNNISKGSKKCRISLQQLVV